MNWKWSWLWAMKDSESRKSREFMERGFFMHQAAKSAGVGYSLTYCEADDSWYFAIHSIAPEEEWIGKNRSI